MSAQDHIDVPCILNQLYIRIRFAFPSEMRQADNQVTVLLILQDIGHTLSFSYRVLKLDISIVFLCYQSVQLRSQSEDTDADTVPFDNNIRLYQTFQNCTLYIIIGTHYRILSQFKQTGHVIQPEIEFMVADGSGVISHLIHQTDFHFPLEQIIIRRTL